MIRVLPATPIEANVLGIIDHIKAVTEALGFQYVMIGARAMEIQLHNVYGLPTNRPTNDTDFAFALGSWEQFGTLKRTLVETGHFSPDTRMEQRLVYNGICVVDLVPFGGLENPQGSVLWPSDSGRVMNVLGFPEINRAAETVLVPESGVSFRVASLPGIVLLKVFAWTDRLNQKDLLDIATIMQDYHSTINQDRLYQDANLLKLMGYDTERVGLVLLGRDAAGLANPPTIREVRRILSTQTGNQNFPVKLASALRGIDSDEKLAKAEGLLELFLSGFVE